MYPESELLPLSGLQHLLFCERQCALIHLECAWQENRLTAEGRILHERVHEREDESRGDVKITRGLRIRSLKLGLYGVADVVEFHRRFDTDWVPYPIEYKRGKPKPDIYDEVQLCAQAICLEEMLGLAISEGAIFYGLPRRRMEVAISFILKERTEKAARRFHALMESGVTPAAVYEKKCDNCSLFSACLPKQSTRLSGVGAYLKKMLE
jgi:CRISPR-associated exonuclease Cas4